MYTGTQLEKNALGLLLTPPVEQEELEPPHLYTQKKRIIILAGPTGCGKSALSMLMAENIPSEIISADSMQVYRGMDIGTAKVTKEERDLVPHHLIDIRNITQSFNVVDFYAEAKHACQQVLDRDNVPIVVGGAGFYIHSLLYGPPNGPPSDAALRKKLEDELEELGSEVMYDRLRKFDPDYAVTITAHDKHKIVRALEIIIITGKEVSKNQWRQRKRLQNFDIRCWFLTRPRSSIYHRIEKRCDKMLSAGLLDEVAELEKQGIRTNPTAAQAIGYRQSLEFLQTSQSRTEYNTFVDELKKASRHYAKRQFTWFRREPAFRWLDLDLHDPETAMDIILRDYDTLRWE